MKRPETLGGYFSVKQPPTLSDSDIIVMFKETFQKYCALE